MGRSDAVVSHLCYGFEEVDSSARSPLKDMERMNSQHTERLKFGDERKRPLINYYGQMLQIKCT